jgi:hypothetical protein
MDSAILNLLTRTREPIGRMNRVTISRKRKTSHTTRKNTRSKLSKSHLQPRRYLRQKTKSRKKYHWSITSFRKVSCPIRQIGKLRIHFPGSNHFVGSGLKLNSVLFLPLFLSHHTTFYLEASSPDEAHESGTLEILGSHVTPHTFLCKEIEIAIFKHER